MPVLVSRSSVPASPIGSRALERRAQRMLDALGLARAELSVVVCDDATIHRLNRTHRKKDKPTDVLAFALREGKVLPGAEDILGDVVISLDTARRQAREHGRSLWAEVTMLLAHGLLHLVGYDHRTDAEERRMNARTDVLVSAAGATERAPRKRTVRRAQPSGGKAGKPAPTAKPARAPKKARPAKAARPAKPARKAPRPQPKPRAPRRKSTAPRKPRRR